MEVRTWPSNIRQWFGDFTRALEGNTLVIGRDEIRAKQRFQARAKI